MKQVIKLVFWTFMVVLPVNHSFGQDPQRQSPVNCPNEEIQVHLSHENVFTGEICWFKIYCTSPLLPGEEISQLAFIELVSSENNSILRKKILLKQGKGMGEFEIPGNLSTGIYYILAYTNWMKNFGEGSFFRKEMIIINPDLPFQNTLNIPDSIVKQLVTSSSPDHGDQLKIGCDRKTYSTRDLVTLTLEMPGKTANPVPGSYSVSVCRKEPPMIFSTREQKDAHHEQELDKILYLPDYKGIRLSGRIEDPSGNGLANAFVIASVPGPGTDLNSSNTNSRGDFNFILKPREGEQDIVLAVQDANPKITLEESFWNGFRNFPDIPAFGFNEEALSFLKEKYTHFQLENRFHKKPAIKNPAVSNLADSSVFYTAPAQILKIGNYISLDSIGEYFYELVPSVKFIRRRGESYFSVIDPRTLSYIPEKPGVFLDGVLFDNYDGIARIPIDEIDRIAILPQTYYYRDFTFGGIIDIHTKKSDFSQVKILPYMNRFIYQLANQSEWKFTSPDYSVPDSRKKIPDFRYLLIWEPFITAENSGETTVRFYTGDVRGEFLVRIMGISSDGKILKTEMEIHVED